MSDFILHHYAGSPFSEKVRLVLGYKGLAWRSVNVPAILPKPDVIALTGGYRRTPFLQVGADIYCDSALMCQVIEAQAPSPTLYPLAAGSTAQILAQWADTDLFWAAVPYTMQPAGVAAMFKGAPPEALKAFGADRAAMSAGMRRAPVADLAAVLERYLMWLEQMLADGRPYLCAGEAPSIADFSVAHSVWFIRRAPPVAGILAPFTQLAAWYERISAVGHGSSTPLGSDEAIAIAAAGQRVPTEVTPGLGFEAGQAVTVTPLDYAFDPVAGELVGLGRDSVTVRRTDERAGTVHVHFPRIGYAIKKQETRAP